MSWFTDADINSSVSNEEADRLNEEALELERTSPAQMLAKAKQAHELSTSSAYEKGTVFSLALIGKAHLRLGDLNKADEILSGIQSVDALELPLQAETYNIRGIVSLYLKHYDRAFVHYQQALDLARSCKNRGLEARMLNNIGEVYRYNGDCVTALDYYGQSIALLEQLPANASISVPIVNLAACYLATDELDRAEHFAVEALRRAQAENDQMIESAALQYLGIVSRRKGMSEAALAYLNQSLEIYRKTQESIHTAEALIELHEVYHTDGEPAASLICLNEALGMAEEAGDLSLQARICAELAKVHENMADLENSIMYYKRRTKLLTSIEQLEQEKMLRNIKTQIKADQSIREKDIFQSLSQQLEQQAEQLSEAYNTLTAISEMGRAITATQDLGTIFAHAHAKLQEMMEADGFGVGMYSEAENSIVYQYLVEDNKSLGTYNISMSSTDSLAITCFLQGEGLMVNSPQEDVSHLIRSISIETGSTMRAVMFQPLKVEGATIGVISVQSRQANVYNDRTLGVLGLLASYLAIAIQNANRSHELQALNLRLADLSNRDGLTGIANRRRFDQFLQDTWHTSVRQGLPVSMLLIDTDCFKQYNDHYGHLVGDETIKNIANAIQGCIYRRTDLVARYGGDEFVVILGDTDREGALLTAEKIRLALDACAIEHAASTIRPLVTLSIGVAAMLPGRSSNPQELIAACDRVLYQAKEAGRDRICIAD